MTSELPLSIRNLSFRYWRREDYALSAIDLELHPGQVMLIAGSSGCGKTTLMRCVNGLIPHTYNGTLDGEIDLFGKPVASMQMSDISQTIGTVLQDPERQILGSYVLNEVAFGLENLGLPREEITSRVNRALDRLGILGLRDRETFSISGGEKQKVALAGVLAMEPRILLLDEPLASLDPASAHEALFAFRQLAEEGIGIMIVEHRVEDVLAINPDNLVYMTDGRITYQGGLGGISQTIDYRKVKLPAQVIVQKALQDPLPDYQPMIKHSNGDDQILVSFEDVRFRYGLDGPEVLKGVSFDVRRGDVIAILGQNGSGKTTLVKHALGLLKPTGGKVTLQDHDTRQSSVAQNARTIGYVFQSPTQMLFAPTVKEELAFGPSNLKLPPDEISENIDLAIETVNLKTEMEMPPLALSFGQQKRVSIAAVLAMRSRILMMDEPTAGQDYWNYISFMDSILQMPGFDAVIFITHDLDLAVIYSNRVLLLHDGQLRADGPPFDVLKDEDLLRSCRVLPTSLLRMNVENYSRTGGFYRAETLAHLIG